MPRWMLARKETHSALEWCAAFARFDTLLRTNDPVLESNAGELRSVLSEARIHLAHLERRISEGSFFFGTRRLARERDELQARVSLYANILSPLRRMPPELLAEIFAFAVLSDPGGTHAAPRMKWDLGQVCRRWRAVCVSLPRLWTDIDIHFCAEHGSAATYPASVLQLQLERSAWLPLRVTFDCDTSGRVKVPHLEHQVRLLRLLVEHCARWATLKIRGCDSLLIELAHVQRRIPILEELDINPLGACPAFHGISDDVFGVAPSLHAAFVNHNPRLGSAVCDIALDPARLQTYAGWNTWTGHAAVLRRSAASLVECCLDTPDVTPCPEIPLPALRRLCVRRAVCLQFISAPALEELFLTGSMSARRPLLAETPALETLHLARADAELNCVVARLRDSPHFMPRLRALAFEAGPEFAAAAFLDMLEARRSLEAVLFCDLPEPDVSRLATLRAAGVRVSIRSRKEFQVAAWLPEGLYLETFNWNC
ncbi:hypothetical protein FB451DRAFT_1493179 [Mycena latifolia]|nr:hypothetical protein FB451DRAFT_1493179 [Mycena latifolia]